MGKLQKKTHTQENTTHKRAKRLKLFTLRMDRWGSGNISEPLLKWLKRGILRGPPAPWTPGQGFALDQPGAPAAP